VARAKDIFRPCISVTNRLSARLPGVACHDELSNKAKYSQLPTKASPYTVETNIIVAGPRAWPGIGGRGGRVPKNIGASGTMTISVAALRISRSMA